MVALILCGLLTCWFLENQVKMFRRGIRRYFCQAIGNTIVAISFNIMHTLLSDLCWFGMKYIVRLKTIDFFANQTNMEFSAIYAKKICYARGILL